MLVYRLSDFALTLGGALLAGSAVESTLTFVTAEAATLEELIVALADTLWKGKRNDALEKRVVEGAAARVGRPFWDVFVPLDTCFEEIAGGGSGRLARSVEW